eukprot:scaffold1074_cov192-Pinguiococcus_pyrenoidosus.AAC.1
MGIDLVVDGGRKGVATEPESHENPCRRVEQVGLRGVNCSEKILRIADEVEADQVAKVLVDPHRRGSSPRFLD